MLNEIFYGIGEKSLPIKTAPIAKNDDGFAQSFDHLLFVE